MPFRDNASEPKNSSVGEPTSNGNLRGSRYKSWLCISIGVILVALSVREYRQERAFVSTGERAQAIVIGQTAVQCSRVAQCYCPIVEFSTTVSGKTRITGDCTIEIVHPTGSPVEVIYDAQQPALGHINEANNIYGTAITELVAGLLLTILGALSL